MPASPVTIPQMPNTWTPANAPADAYAELGSPTQPVGLGSAKMLQTAFVLHVASIAVLRTAKTTNRATGSVLVVDGYSAAGDGGGGRFYWNAASTADDDGGSVIRPTAIIPANPGRWERESVPSVSLRSFGGDPTAAVDCRNQLQRALNWCRTIGAELVGPGDFRVASTLPIYVGRVNMRNLRFWQTLPDDYSWSTYVTDTYTANNVVDRYGALVTWNATVPALMPWNGKTQMFELAVDCTIEDVHIDGGWWYLTPWGYGTSTYPAALPVAKSIRGVRYDNEEQTYYQIFAASERVTFKNCQFYNSPGAIIESGYNNKMIGCSVLEYGDHVYYMGPSYRHQIHGNYVEAYRTTSGSPGDRNYLFETNRTAFKFRGNTEISVQGNLVILPSSNCHVLELQATGSAIGPGDCTNVMFTGNLIARANPFFFSCDRGGATPYAADGSGYRLRNVLVAGNEVYSEGGYFGIMRNVACDSLTVRNNKFYSTGQGHIWLQPSPEYVNPIQGLSIKDNDFRVTANSVIRAYGEFWGPGTFDCSGNEVEWLTTPSVLLAFDSGYDSTCEFESMRFAKNTLRSAFAMFGIYRSLVWDALATYTGFERTYADGAINRGSVVYSVGIYYRARVNIAGNVANLAPAADPTRWAVYTRSTVQIVATNNTITKTNSSGFLFYFLCDWLGFIVFPVEQNTCISDAGGTVLQPLLKDPACNDVVTNLDNSFFNSATIGPNGSRIRNLRHGLVALVAGTTTIADTLLTSNTRIFVTNNLSGGTPGRLDITARTNGVNFVITSTSGTDTSAIAWMAFEI